MNIDVCWTGLERSFNAKPNKQVVSALRRFDQGDLIVERSTYFIIYVELKSIYDQVLRFSGTYNRFVDQHVEDTGNA